MNIGFIKFGLKTYFNKNGSGQGSNHELVSVFEIFEKNGHHCQMVSGSDKYPQDKDINGLDHLFVFNGPNTLYDIKNSILLLQKYTLPYIDIINNSSIPYTYFWTDPRREYDILKNKNIIRKPNFILSQEREFYGHLEKLITHNKSVIINNKDIKFSIVANDTHPRRSKNLLQVIDYLDYGEIYGKWKTKNKWLRGSIQEDDVINHLSRVRYSYNEAVDVNWVSQKYYEMILGDVICFYKNYDRDNLLMRADDFRRVRDVFELEEKIDLLEKDKKLYDKVISDQRDELKLEFKSGELIYNLIIKKLCMKRSHSS